jgi:hypothetical protein
MRTRLSICHKKARYGSAAEANQAAISAPFPLRSYFCDRCQRFHLTGRTKGKWTGLTMEKCTYTPT